MAEKPLPAHIVGPLMDKLGSDDKFREQFQADPKAALSSLGVTEDLDTHAATCASCMQSNALPTKEQFTAARRQSLTQANQRFDPFIGFTS